MNEHSNNMVLERFSIAGGAGLHKCNCSTIVYGNIVRIWYDVDKISMFLIGDG